MTPEGKIKSIISQHLEEASIMPAKDAAKFFEKDIAHKGWYYMPVSSGHGVHGIPDFLGHYQGKFFAIEAKAPGGKVSPRQKHQLYALMETGAMTFVVSTEEEAKQAVNLITGATP